MPASIVRSVRLPRELHAELVKLAHRRELSTNALIVRAIRYGLPRLRPRRPRRSTLPPAPVREPENGGSDGR